MGCHESSCDLARDRVLGPCSAEVAVRVRLVRMSAKMRRRRSRTRHKARATRRREDALFFGRGELPVSARRWSFCSCGAQAFSRAEDDYEFFEDFDAAHAYCDEAWSA